jgi:hypothetical protein
MIAGKSLDQDKQRWVVSKYNQRQNPSHRTVLESMQFPDRGFPNVCIVFASLVRDIQSLCESVGLGFYFLPSYAFVFELSTSLIYVG